MSRVALDERVGPKTPNDLVGGTLTRDADVIAMVDERDTGIRHPARADKTVLIVDDNQDWCDTGKILLEYAGYCVITASSPLAALALFGEQRPDVVLLDMAMPDMDGIELFHRIRAIPSCATLPMAFVTGYARLAGDGSPIGKGVELRTKPVDPTDLLRLVDTLAAIHN